MGITATYISDKEAAGSKERKQAIKNGMFQIVFISPEALILLKWLRKEFSDLGEIGSIVPRCVHLMALTATATLSTRKFIIKNLDMQDTAIVYIPQNNIIYFVTDKPRGGISEAF